MLRILRRDLERLMLERPAGQRPAALLKRIAEWVLAFSFYYTGLTGRLLNRLLRSQGAALILGFHGITEGAADPFTSGHARSTLESQLSYLSRHLQAVSLDRIAVPVSRGEDPPPACFAVTFDDGLGSNVRLGLPLLQRLGIPATFFVPSGLVGSDRDLWVTGLRETIRTWPAPRIEGEPGLWPELPVSSPGLRYAAYFRIKEALKAHEERRMDVLVRLAAQSAGMKRPPEDDRVVSRELLARMGEPPCDIGAHSRNHPVLSGLDPSEAWREIDGSRKDLESLLGRPVLDFAYPNGRFTDFDETSRRQVEEAGYRCAVTTEPGMVRRGDDHLALRRCLPEDVPAFVASFDLLLQAWIDRTRPRDLSLPLARRPSRLAPVSSETSL